MDFQSFKPVALNAPTVSTQLDFADLMGALKMRLGFGRDHYTVKPGLYRVGSPDSNSDVLISANYKLSFDMLRKELDGLNLWILVVDTNGINVWCAAGKGTFGTERVVKSIKDVSLEHMVKHRKVILPQLCASGVAAHLVKEQTGFKAIFGPVLAKDFKAFVSAGYKATPEMRKMNFPMKERAKLIPNDFKYGGTKLLLLLVGLFFVSGLDRTGFLFEKMLSTGLFPVLNIFAAYFAGIVLGPLFLTWIPFRAFTLKGIFWGVASTVVLNLFFSVTLFEALGLGLMNVSIASFMTMNFTGSSTFTSLSGVQREMKWAIPLQIGLIATGFILFVVSKFI
ncbi:MAG TPA: mercury methylation corrinoid protein HgcA [Bacteroidales bacterium]|nr:mercury methylation corrinoid protein HgcA [Bacteroidales bacterium]